MRHPGSRASRAERRAAPKPARASRETRLAFEPERMPRLAACRPMYPSDEGLS
jgi:hypothetical protein